jgi:hypothetical protein
MFTADGSCGLGRSGLRPGKAATAELHRNRSRSAAYEDTEPDTRYGPIITRQVRDAWCVGALMGIAVGTAFRKLLQLALVAGLLFAFSGCADSHKKMAAAPPRPSRVIVVAPVLNLSGSQDFDALKITDLVASELVSTPGLAVVPVNLALAELQRQGKYAVETAQDAVDLARAFNADATVVTAVTEYNPYSPPVVGLIMQWYPANSAVAEGSARLSDAPPGGPRWQVQRVFNAADEDLLEEVRHFARERDGDKSPYSWRKYVRSQELYVRFCTHSLILTMARLDRNDRVATEPSETKS